MIPRRSSPRRDRKLQKLLLIPSAVLVFFLFKYLSRPSSTIPLSPDVSQQRYKTGKVPNRTFTRKTVMKPKKPRLGSIHYRPDGLVDTNENAPHPIYELIYRAEKEWDWKKQKQSKTLEQAVGEYKRRYRRAPPRGFDQWWQYVQDNNVQLPDEYDMIHRDLEHFWAVEPQVLREIQAKLEDKFDSFTIGKTKGSPLDIVKKSLPEEHMNAFLVRAYEILDLLTPVQDLLPELRATFSPHDGPNRLTDQAIMASALKAAAAGKFIDMNNLPETKKGWVSACDPLSAARLHPIDLDNLPPLPSQKTFIHDHTLTMDPCLHPNHLWQHGQYVGQEHGPDPQRGLIPEFSLCTTTLHHDIRFPTMNNWVEDVPRENDPEWEQKIEERMLWRGSNTGIIHTPNNRWKTMHRTRFVAMTNELVGTFNVLSPNRTKDEAVGPPLEFKKARVNPAMMDVAYTNEPVMCEGSACADLEEMFEFRKFVGLKEAGRYKYVFDTDGNGWSSRFKRLITTNSLIFKSTIYPEWYQDRIAPWVHYIPIQLDLSDLYDALIFFRGDVAGNGAHDDMARKIASEGRKWSKELWRKEDMTAYMYRLLLEYARLTSLNREEHSFKLRQDDD